MDDERRDAGTPHDDWALSPARWMPICVFVGFFLYVVWNSCCFRTVTL